MSPDTSEVMTSCGSPRCHPGHYTRRVVTAYPDPTTMSSLVDILDEAARRYPTNRAILSLRTDEGLVATWSAAELRRRAHLAAWRLRAAGLQPGDRLLTWSPSTPALPAVFWGAMIAEVVLVPLDLRMAPGVLQRIAGRSGSQFLALGTGHDAPDPGSAGLGHLQVLTLDELTAEPLQDDPGFPTGWEHQIDGWTRPTRDSLFEIVYTSGTTAQPKGVMLTHGNFLATLDACRGLVPPRHHRLVSLLPLSHLFEQAPVLFYGTVYGAEIVYVRSRNPRVIFEAMRELRVTTMVVTPQLLEIFWTALEREIDRQGRRRIFEHARRLARHLPYPVRRLLFRTLHRQLGGALTLLVSAGAYLPPELQIAWEDLGIIVLQGYGATECGGAAANSEQDHPVGVVGRPLPPNRLRLAESTSEILVAGPAVMVGYWGDPEATAAAIDEDGWYHTGDVGRFDDEGRLILSGRIKNIIVLPNGLNVFPEDIEGVLNDHGLAQAVVIETAPGRIEAVVLPPGTMPVVAAGRGGQSERTPEEDAHVRAEIDRIVREANAELSTHQRIDAWRLWPDRDFPRTHTLKIRRDAVREWASTDIPLQVREELAVATSAPGPVARSS
jgi:long-chain acyl-CoA synthetase